MVAADDKVLKVATEAFQILFAEVQGGESKRQLGEFLKVILSPTVEGYGKEHPLDHMLKGAQGAKHFPGVKLDDPREVADIFRSFFRCWIDTKDSPVVPGGPVEVNGGSVCHFGRFSGVHLKGKVFKFRLHKDEPFLRAAHTVTREDQLEFANTLKLKHYCHRAGQAAWAGRIGGGLGAGLGSYCMERLYRKMCEEYDHEIGKAEKVAMWVGREVSIPLGTFAGSTIAQYVAGFQSVSMMGPIKFQLCCTLSGAAAGFLVACAVTGAAPAIGWAVDVMVLETAESLKLAYSARARRLHLERYMKDMTQNLTNRFKAITQDMNKIEHLIGDAQKALKHGMKSEDEILRWIGVGPAAKVLLEQILPALDQLEQDIYKHLGELRKQHARIVEDLKAAVDRKKKDSCPPPGLVLGITAPLLFLGPVGIFTSVALAGLSFTHVASLESAIQSHKQIKSQLEDAMRHFEGTLGNFATLRWKACAAIEQLEYLLDNLAAKLHSLCHNLPDSFESRKAAILRHRCYCLCSILLVGLVGPFLWISMCFFLVAEFLLWPVFPFYIQWHHSALIRLIACVGPIILLQEWISEPVVVSMMALVPVYLCWPCISLSNSWWGRGHPRAFMHYRACQVSVLSLTCLQGLSYLLSKPSLVRLHLLSDLIDLIDSCAPVRSFLLNPLACLLPVLLCWPSYSIHVWWEPGSLLRFRFVALLFSILLASHWLSCYAILLCLVPLWNWWPPVVQGPEKERSFEESWLVQNLIPEY